MKIYLHKNIKAYRFKIGKSQHQLSRQLKIKRCTLSAWEEKRAYPPLPMVLKLSKLFGVSMEKMCFTDIYSNYQKVGKK